VRAVARELRAEPALAAINSHVHQKLACERSRSAVLRCDGDARIGMGHVTRSLAIAAELRDAHAWGVVFAVASGDAAVDAIRRAGFGVERARGGDEAAWLEAVLAARAPDALVLDVRTALSRDVVARWRARGVVTVVVDDASDRRLAAGLAFFPPVPQVRRLDWTGFTGRLLAGWEWVPLRRSFADPPSRDEGRGTRVLVTMGGSDPAGLTARALAALDLVAAELTVDVVVGAAFRGAEALASRLESFRHPATVHRDVADPAPLMRGATLAIAALGVTAYELAACGAPSLLLSLTDDHAESASAFAEAGIALSLGVHTAVTDAAIARGVEVLLADATRRAAMGACARSVVDGRGAARIAAEIAAEAAGR
jgi:spore coat polysaccharide biosynthesis protein SpsF